MVQQLGHGVAEAASGYAALDCCGNGQKSMW